MHIRGLLRDFGELLGATVTEEKISRDYYCPILSRIKQRKVSIFTIDLAKQLTYHIKPIEIAGRHEMAEKMYNLYNINKFCDFSLKSKSGSINIHSTQLYLYGGKFFEKLIDNDLKETQEKAIDFQDFSIETIKFFTDYLYLGSKVLTPQYYNNIKVDLSELFLFAHTYQVSELMNCCTNLFAFLATEDDLETVENLMTTYDNEHLKELYAALKAQVVEKEDDKTNLMKVY